MGGSISQHRKNSKRSPRKRGSMTLLQPSSAQSPLTRESERDALRRLAPPGSTPQLSVGELAELLCSNSVLTHQQNTVPPGGRGAHRPPPPHRPHSGDSEVPPSG
ncbi:unnamed protein product [Gadus morhua 'NCC']